jgi:pimeloyl-ACP methyl ester carboxylesterase/acyl carrier protein
MIVRTAIAAQATTRDQTLELLRDFVVDELLDGDPQGLDAQTPLLEWGVIDSLAMVQLLAFIEDRIGVRVPDEQVKPEHFQNLAALCELLERLPRGDARAPEEGPACMLESRGVRSTTLSTRAGGSLHLWRTPQKRERPAWLILPALGAQAADWDVLLRNLVGDQEAAALDWPGFGRSTWPAQPRFEEQRAAALAALDLLTAERGEPIVIVAHSLGALIAQELVRARPSAVRALACIGFGQVADTPEEAAAWWSSFAHAHASAGELLERGWHQPPHLGDAARAALDASLAQPAFAGFWDAAATESAARGFADLHLPTLFVAGVSDRLVSRTAVEHAAARVPGARVEWLARCGHFVPSERPQELLMVLNVFLYARSK